MNERVYKIAWVVCTAVVLSGCFGKTITMTDEDQARIAEGKLISRCTGGLPMGPVPSIAVQQENSNRYLQCMREIYREMPTSHIRMALAGAVLSSGGLLASQKRCKEALPLLHEWFSSLDDPECTSTTCRAGLGSASFYLSQCGEGAFATRVLEKQYAQRRGEGGATPGTFNGFHASMELAMVYAQNKEDLKAVALGLETLSTVSPVRYAISGRGLYPILLLSQSAARLGKGPELTRFLGLVGGLIKDCPLYESPEDVHRQFKAMIELARAKGLTTQANLAQQLDKSYHRWNFDEGGAWLKAHRDEVSNLSVGW